MSAENAVLVPMEVKYESAWLTWVAATTACLRALGVQCDMADVAGMSGYAFMLAVHEELCPSGPTMHNWGLLEGGICMLGRSVLSYKSWDCHTKEAASDITRAHCREAFEHVEREVRAGRPCVLWGTYVPEFGVAVGVQDRHYLVKTFYGAIGREEPPIPWDGVNAPGGPYVLALPTATSRSAPRPHADRYAVGLAAQLLYSRSPMREYSFGLEAYDRWVQALESNRAAPFGNSYNAQCYHEGRAFARDFLKRVCARNPQVAALAIAADAYAEAAEAMAHVAKLFPFPYEAEAIPEQDRREAVGYLRAAQAAETRTAEALTAAVYADWKSEALTSTA
jgi:hypothetical protein